MNTIAIDCGASFIKAALIKDSNIVKRIDRKTPPVKKNKDIFDISLIWGIKDTVLGIIDELSKEEMKVNLCISNEMHGFIITDLIGDPVIDYVSWQYEFGNICVDGTTGKEVLSKEEFNEDIMRTGMNVRGGLPSSNMWFLKNKKILPKETLYFYTLGDFLIRSIFVIEPFCHPSNAAATGIFDIVSGDWNKRLIDLVSENVVFPKIDEKNITLKRNDTEFNIFPCIGDYQAALLGAGVNDSSDLSFNLGTGAQVSVFADNLNFSKNYQILPYFNGRYLKRIPHLPSGRALNVYYRFFVDVLKHFEVQKSENEIWNIMIKSVEEADDACNMDCSLSFFENPIEDSVKGNITEIGEFDFTFSNLVRCVLDREARNFIWAAKELTRNDIEVRRIIFSGGIARKNEFIRKQILHEFENVKDIKIASDETLLGLYNYSLL